MTVASNINVVDIRDINRKFDTPEDVKEIISEFLNKKVVTTLKFSGNSFGIPACKEIGAILRKYPEITTCHFNDIFTSRLKTEIAPSLEHISGGLLAANVRLVELDLSDNAFGPNGVVGITTFIASESCSTLKVLKMNNQGLGIGGAKLLADAMKQARKNSNDKGFNLKLFWAARNRFENEGIGYLAQVISQINTLENIAFYQNSIGVKGIEGPKSLAIILKSNPHLKHVNFSDNSIKPDGSEYLVNSLKKLKHLESLELDDCLLRNEGSRILTRFLDDPDHLSRLEKLCLDGNEIGKSAGIKLCLSLSGKTKLRHLSLNSNEFGTNGVVAVMNTLHSINLLKTLHKPADWEPEHPINDDWEEIRQYAFGEDSGHDEDALDETNEGLDEDEYYEEDGEYDEEDYENEEEEEEDENQFNISSDTVIRNPKTETSGLFSFKKIDELPTCPNDKQSSLFSNILSSADKNLKNLFKPTAKDLTSPIFKTPLLTAPQTPPNKDKLKKLLVEACSQNTKFNQQLVDSFANAIMQNRIAIDKTSINECLNTCIPEQVAHTALHLLERGPITDVECEKSLMESCINILSLILTDNEFSKDNPVFSNASRAANALLVHLGAIKPEVGDVEMKRVVKAAEPFFKSHLQALKLTANDPDFERKFSTNVKLSLISILGKRRPKLTTLNEDFDRSLEEIVNAFQNKMTV